MQRTSTKQSNSFACQRQSTLFSQTMIKTEYSSQQLRSCPLSLDHPHKHLMKS
jgi:hypothetical protein